MDNLENYSKEELIAQIKALKAHNDQLKNIIAKSNESSKPTKANPRKNFNFEKCVFRHVLLKFLYLGWDYQGYVVQEDTINTIEHHIFKALEKTCLIENRASSNYHRCGRTDKGVSSFSQVISIDLRSKSNSDDELDYCKMLNRVLPDDIQFIAWCPVDDNFSARFDCKGRTYKYFFAKGHLNIEKMKTAATHLIGSHDFRNFCKMDVNNGVTEFTRTISFIDINIFHKEPNDNYSIYVVTIKGNAFLWHQVRCIIGILLLIGQGKEEPEIIRELLDVSTNPRKPNYNMASEIPLNLYETDYDNIKWIYDKGAISTAFKKLHNIWTFTTIKSTMIKSMLMDLLRKTTEENDQCPSEYLLQGVKSRNYIPVMKRQLCESLEDKIEHSLKRKRKTRGK